MKEVEQFKRINLVDFILVYGGEIDNKKSSRNHKIVNYGDTKLCITKKENGHYIFFDISTGKGGTIIDFIKNFHNKKIFYKQLQEIRNTLKNGIPTKSKEIISSSVDKEKIITVSSKFTYQNNFKYLIRQRKLSRITLNKFDIYKDLKGNNVYKQNNFFYEDNKFQVELSGWKAENDGFKQQQGEKGIWGKIVGDDIEQDKKTFYIFESEIDAMSYYQLKKSNGTYLSTGGNLSEKQITSIKSLYKQQKADKIVFCFDNDEAGRRLESRLKDFFPIAAQRADVSESKDWNQDLKNIIAKNYKERERIYLEKQKEKEIIKKQLEQKQEQKEENNQDQYDGIDRRKKSSENFDGIDRRKKIESYYDNDLRKDPTLFK